MNRRSPSPLDGVDRLLVDGTNLLHALRRGTALPPAALIGRLRGAVPPEVSIEIVFDGRPEAGMGGERIASGIHVRYSGRRSADDLLLSLVANGTPDTTLVVTDDRDLRHALHARGARSAGSAWLIGRLERRTLAAPSPGNRRPPGPGHRTDEARKRWSPGRGATAKRGNPRRAPRVGRRRA